MDDPRASRLGLTVYCATAGDHNHLAMAGAVSIGSALSKQLGIAAEIIGPPGHVLNAGWEQELKAAMPALSKLAVRLDGLFSRRLAPISALSRCAASLATLPCLMRHRPDACVVWLDAHADLNTPETTPSGYLGGMALSGPAGLWDSGLGNGLPLSSILLVGARDLDPAEQMLVATGMLKRIPPGSGSLARLRSAIAKRPLYIHLDCDVLEPGIVPTDYRVPGGLTLAQLHALCEVLAENELAGVEIAEFENAWGEGEMPVSPSPLLDALDPLLSRLGVARRAAP
jgi:arginase family enzyme